MIFNLDLENKELYAGCAITEVGGRLNLITPSSEAANIIGRNAIGIIDAIPAENRKEIILTGSMAIWSYLVVFHIVVHRFNKVYYDDGRNNRILIAAH